MYPKGTKDEWSDDNLQKTHHLTYHFEFKFEKLGNKINK